MQQRQEVALVSFVAVLIEHKSLCCYGFLTVDYFLLPLSAMQLVGLYNKA